MVDFTLTPTGTGAEFGFDKADSLQNNVYLSVMLRRGSFFADTEFGSRLYELGKVTEDALRLARDYCMEALQWLLDTDRAVNVAVDCERNEDDAGRIDIAVAVTKPDGEIVPVEMYYEVV